MPLNTYSMHVPSESNGSMTLNKTYISVVSLKAHWVVDKAALTANDVFMFSSFIKKTSNEIHLHIFLLEMSHM